MVKHLLCKIMLLFKHEENKITVNQDMPKTPAGYDLRDMEDRSEVERETAK